MPAVTDPAILEQLNGTSGGTPVTDPAVLSQLNGTDQPKPVSDPALLAQLNAPAPGRFSGPSAPPEIEAGPDAETPPTASPQPHSDALARRLVSPGTPGLPGSAADVLGAPATTNDQDFVDTAALAASQPQPPTAAGRVGPTVANLKAQQDADQAEKIQNFKAQNAPRVAAMQQEREAEMAKNKTADLSDYGSDLYSGILNMGSGTGKFLAMVANNPPHGAIPDVSTAMQVAATSLIRLGLDKGPDGKYAEPDWSKADEDKAAAIANPVTDMKWSDASRHGQAFPWIVGNALKSGPQVALGLVAAIQPELAPVVFTMIGVPQAGEYYHEDVKAGIDPHTAVTNAIVKAAIQAGASTVLPVGISQFAKPAIGAALRALPAAESTSLAQSLVRGAFATAVGGAENIGANVAGMTAAQIGSNLSDKLIAGKDVAWNEGLEDAAMQSIVPAVAFYAHGAIPHLARTGTERVAEVMINRALEKAAQPGQDLNAVTAIVKQGIDAARRADPTFTAHKLVQLASYKDETAAAVENPESEANPDINKTDGVTPLNPTDEELTASYDKLFPEEAPKPAPPEPAKEPAKNGASSDSGEAAKEVATETPEEAKIRKATNAYRGGDGEGGSLKVGDLKVTPLSPDEQRLSNAIESITGTKLKFVEGIDPKSTGGFVVPGIKDSLYLVRGNKDPLEFIVGHELGHILEQQHPDLYKSLLTSLRPMLKDHEDALAFHARQNDADFSAEDKAALLKRMTTDKGNGLGTPIEGEMTSDYIGRRLMDPEFLHGLSRKDPELFGQIIQHIREFFDRLTSTLKDAFPAHSDYVKDIIESREAVEKTFHEWALRNNPRLAGTRALKTGNLEAVRAARTGKPNEETNVTLSAARPADATGSDRESGAVRTGQESGAAGDQADTGSVPDGGGVRRGLPVLDESHGQSAGDDKPLNGLPQEVRVDGKLVTFGPFKPARDAARAYVEGTGRPYNPPTDYVKVNPERAARIAQAFEEMKHAPDDPKVKASYRAMIDETVAQWQAIKKTGLKVQFITGDDPYGNPRHAILDVVHNNHLWIRPTESAYQGILANIGLHVNDGSTITTQDVMSALKAAGADIIESAVHQSATEPTMVVSLAKAMTREQAEGVAKALRQEAIAQLAVGEGNLFGPMAKAWEPFDAKQFIMLDGKMASDMGEFTDNPLLEPTAETIDGRATVANDIFRIVHDYFGHVKEGNGFRADGEENAWRSHAAMYSDLARPAMTAETRGQNSWVNFGPYAESNKTASGADTQYAPQKTGLLPDFAMESRNRSSAVDVRESEAPSPLGRNPNVDAVGRHFDDEIKEKFGRALDYKDPKDFKRATINASEEFKYQLGTAKSGLDWYTSDIKSAYELTKKFIPELEDPAHQKMFSVVVALMSPESKANENWVKAGEAYKHFVDNGAIPETNPYSGELWGPKTGRIKAQALSHLNWMIENMGVRDAAEWLLTPHSVADIRAMKLKSGMYKGHNVSGKAGDIRLGVEMFGDKVGPFAMNLNGMDTAVTVDKWMTRTFNRYFGTIMNAKGEMHEAPTDVERPYIKKLVEDVAKENGYSPSQVQSVLWFFEQQLYNKLGAGSKSYAFSDGARELLDANSIEHGGAERSDASGSGRIDEAAPQGKQAPARAIQSPSRAVTHSPQFKRWFGESKVVDDKGMPEVWYHGTAQDIHSFKPKQANAIFLTSDPKFAEGFSAASLDYMAKHIENHATPQQIAKLESDVKRQIVAFSDPSEMSYHLENMKESGSYHREIQKLLPSNENIMPLYVKADKPFDYHNEEDIEAVVNKVFEDGKTAKQDNGEDSLVVDGKNTLYTNDVMAESLRQGLWSLIEEPYVQKAIKALGYDGFYVMEGGRKNLAVYKPDQVKSATGNRGTFEPGNADISASPARRQSSMFTTAERGRFELPEQKARDKAREVFVDRFQRIEQLVNWVGEQGGTVTDQNNIYYAIRRMPGTTDARVSEFSHDIVGPIIKDAAKTGVKMDDAMELLYALHAKERNEQIAKINPKMPDGGSGLMTDDAARIIQGFKDSPDYAKVKAIADRVQAITVETADTLRREGLITPEEKDAWFNTYKQYVPLRGGDDTAGDFNVYGRGKLIDERGKTIDRAMGRFTAADPGQIFANIVNDRVSAIVRSEKNKVGKTLMKFTLDNPDNNLWEIDKIKSGRTITHNADGTETVVDTASIDRGDNTIVVKVGGQEYSIKIKDQALADQLLGMSHENMDVFLRSMGSINRLWVKLWTQWNPVFVARNFSRDVQTALTHTAVQYGAARTAKITKDLPAAVAAMYQYGRGARSTTPGDMLDFVHQFIQNGGHVGHINMLGLEERVNQLKHLYNMEKSPVWMAPAKAGEYLLDIVSNANNAGENGIRIATYKAAIEEGKSVQEAVHQARNIRVDFNKRGNYGPQLNSLFLFFNPAMQESARIYDAIKRNPVKMTAAVSMMSALGFAMASLSSQDVDEDGVAYWDKPEYDNQKQRNLMIIIPGTGGKAVLIPLPYGYNTFYNLGYAIHDKLKGKKDDWQISKQLADATWAGMSPVGGQAGSTGMAAFLPTFFQPIEYLMANKDEFGQKIMPGDENLPSSERYKPGTRGTPQQIATTWLNSATGGDSHIAGHVSISPEMVNYFVRYTTGGLGTFLVNTLTNAFQAAVGGVDTMDWEKLPFLREMYIDQHKPERDAGLYYERLSQLKAVVASYDEAVKAQDADKVDAMKDRFGTDLLIKVAGAMQGFQTTLKGLREQEIALADDKDIPSGDKAVQMKELARKRGEVYMAFNAMFTDANNGKLKLDIP